MRDEAKLIKKMKLQDKKKLDQYKKDKKDFFNISVSMRKDVPDVLFFEKIEFLVQTMILSMDDELIGYIYKFGSNITNQLHTNITGVHEVFHQTPSF